MLNCLVFTRSKSEFSWNFLSKNEIFSQNSDFQVWAQTQKIRMQNYYFLAWSIRELENRIWEFAKKGFRLELECAINFVIFLIEFYQGCRQGLKVRGCLTTSRGCLFLSSSNTFPITSARRKTGVRERENVSKNYSQKTMEITGISNSFRFMPSFN